MSQYKQVRHLMQNRPADISENVTIFSFKPIGRKKKTKEKKRFDIPADEVQHAENVSLLECPCEQQSVKKYSRHK